MPKEVNIVDTINAKGGTPPFTVWSSGFRDIIDGQPSGGSPPHKGTYDDVSRAVQQFEYLTRIEPGKDVLITQPPRIVDSTGKQVYP